MFNISVKLLLLLLFLCNCSLCVNQVMGTSHGNVCEKLGFKMEETATERM